MIRLELDDAQAEMLRSILMLYLGDLRMEVAATDSKDYRDELKIEEQFIKDLLLELPVEPAPHVHH